MHSTAQSHCNGAVSCTAQHGPTVMVLFHAQHSIAQSHCNGAISCTAQHGPTVMSCHLDLAARGTGGGYSSVGFKQLLSACPCACGGPTD